MNRIEELTKKVRNLYDQKNPGRADWADWLYENHIFVVAEYGKELAQRYGAKQDLVVAAAFLHDIADALMQRENPQHEEKSKEIAKDFLSECYFTRNEMEVIVNDAIEFHGCKNGKIPKTLEGKVMATADAIAHLKSDFYSYSIQAFAQFYPNEDVRAWALPKIERDYRNKIFFEEIRLEAKDDYERAKARFA